MTRQTTPDFRLIAAMVEARAAACLACAEECERHAAHQEHCRVCAAVCRRCKQACDDLLAKIGQPAKAEHSVGAARRDREANLSAAQSLFISPSTVEYHLGKVLRKLNVKSRTQLANRLRAQERDQIGSGEGRVGVAPRR